MFERQRGVLETYKFYISRLYKGLVHIGAMVAAGVAAIGLLRRPRRAYVPRVAIGLATRLRGDAQYVMHQGLRLLPARDIGRYTGAHH
jgi:hypothetical protein